MGARKLGKGKKGEKAALGTCEETGRQWGRNLQPLGLAPKRKH